MKTRILSEVLRCSALIHMSFHTLTNAHLHRWGTGEGGGGGGGRWVKAKCSFLCAVSFHLLSATPENGSFTSREKPPSQRFTGESGVCVRDLRVSLWTCRRDSGGGGWGGGVCGGPSQNEIYGDLKEMLRFYAVQYVYSQIKQRTLPNCSPNLQAFTSLLFSSTFCLIVFPPRPLEHLLQAVSITIQTKCLLCQWCQVEWCCS